MKLQMALDQICFGRVSVPETAERSYLGGVETWPLPAVFQTFALGTLLVPPSAAGPSVPGRRSMAGGGTSGQGVGLVLLLVPLALAYDWGGRLTQPTCLEIPANLTLCRDIGYSKMRLPNLLEHDSMAEVQQQARSWVQLANRRCHPDTQLFLCSLFSPVCLERPIFPCRSLCEAVRSGCEGTMLRYGYPWPDMVRCDKFPVDNDMCISVQSNNQPAPGELISNKKKSVTG